MKTINITIYCDEVKNAKIPEDEFNKFQRWDYIGILIVPTENIKSLSYELNLKRCPRNDYNMCKENCCYHNVNKVKLHYQRYDNSNNYNIANRWCDVIINNTCKNRKFYTHILGINVANIDKSYFKRGDEKVNVENNIYNRFFRTAIKYAIKNFLSDYDEVIIDNIFHDCGNMDSHQYFKRQPLSKLKQEVTNVRLNCREIISLPTTNDNCLDFNNVLLQFIDLYLGAVLNCLHASSRGNKERIALKLYDVIDHCVNNSGNKNSKYYKVNCISFFPRYKIDENDDWYDVMYKRENNFYSKRELRIAKNDQLSILDFM